LHLSEYIVDFFSEKDIQVDNPWKYFNYWINESDNKLFNEENIILRFSFILKKMYNSDIWYIPNYITLNDSINIFILFLNKLSSDFRMLENIWFDWINELFKNDLLKKEILLNINKDDISNFFPKYINEYDILRLNFTQKLNKERNTVRNYIK
jgi:hypothetical protein